MFQTTQVIYKHCFSDKLLCSIIFLRTIYIIFNCYYLHNNYFSGILNFFQGTRFEFSTILKSCYIIYIHCFIVYTTNISQKGIGYDTPNPPSSPTSKHLDSLQSANFVFMFLCLYFLYVYINHKVTLCYQYIV